MPTDFQLLGPEFILVIKFLHYLSFFLEKKEFNSQGILTSYMFINTRWNRENQSSWN